MNQKTLFEQPPDLARFDGPDPENDEIRLTGQIERIWKLMRDGQWRTVELISTLTGAPPNSVQAQLRNLRKERFGAFLVERRPFYTTYEYRVGPKGAGTPQHARCRNCEILEGRIVELEALLVRQASRKGAECLSDQ